jgi:hypothetical protein
MFFNQSLIQVSTSDPHKRTLISTLLIANTHTRNTFGVNYWGIVDLALEKMWSCFHVVWFFHNSRVKYPCPAFSNSPLLGWSPGEAPMGDRPVHPLIHSDLLLLYSESPLLRLECTASCRYIDLPATCPVCTDVKALPTWSGFLLAIGWKTRQVILLCITPLFMFDVIHGCQLLLFS